MAPTSDATFLLQRQSNTRRWRFRAWKGAAFVTASMCRRRRNDGKRGLWWHLAAAAVSPSGLPSLGRRPFGYGVILGGYDRDGPQLYMVEPSGISYLCLVMVSLSSLGKMCDAYTPAGEPIPTNKSHNAAKIFSNPEVAMEEPWYQDFYCAIVV
nr:glutamine synthetase cytosolic isozyme 1-1 [Ipomoea batatas]